MRNLKIIGVLIICAFYSNLNAQYKSKVSKAIATLEIKEAMINGSDYTTEALKAEACFIFYKSNQNEILLSNYWTKSKSQSFGPIYSVVKEDEVVAEFKTEKYHFEWSYANTYDKDKGTASVKLLVIHKPQGKYFEFTIFTKGLEVLLYNGFMQNDLTLLDVKVKG